MIDNRTDLDCPVCKSPISAHRSNKDIVLECQYCGTSIKHIDDLPKVKEDWFNEKPDY